MGFEFLVPWHAFLPREGGHVVVCYGHEDALRLRDAVAAALDEAEFADAGAPCLCCEMGPTGLDAAAVDVLAAEHPGRVVLVAAATAVAALPARTSLALPVVPLTSAPERDWDALLDEICGPAGLLACAAAGMPAAPALLRLDDCLDSIGLFAALDRLMEERGVPIFILGEVRGPQPRLRAAFRAAGPSPRPDPGPGMES
jgi:NAD(P)-dependent dehydrogenase (short-subunit alcohol dehydrogenase family)